MPRVEEQQDNFLTLLIKRTYKQFQLKHLFEKVKNNKQW